MFLLVALLTPPTENIRDAKHGWLMATHNALCHGHAFKCQLGYCDRWCLEGPRTWGVWGLGHVKTDGQTDILSSWQYDKDPPCPCPQAPVGAATGPGRPSNTSTHSPVPLLRQSWSALAKTWRCWAGCDSQTALQSHSFICVTANTTTNSLMKDSLRGTSRLFNQTNSHQIQLEEP